MEEVLVFHLHGPLTAWGGVAVGEVRDSEEVPSRSALLGLLAAAVGLRRDQTGDLEALGRTCRFACRIDRSGRLLQDYHTAQVPPQTVLKHRPHRTRRDELACPARELSTILSTRQYRMDAAYTILVSAREAPGTLHSLAEALDKPRFVPYLGRKSCTLAWPMSPRIIQAESLVDAFQRYDQQEAAAWTSADNDFQELAVRALGSEEVPPSLAWEKDLPLAAGMIPLMLVNRRDEPLSRQRWQFSERQEARGAWPLEKS